MMDARSAWGWLAKGLGGIANMIVALAAVHPKTTPHIIEILQKERDKIVKVVARLRDEEANP